jgi:hypothetical protein
MNSWKRGFNFFGGEFRGRIYKNKNKRFSKIRKPRKMPVETIQEGGRGKIAKYVVERKWSLSEETAKMNTYVQRSQIDKIIEHDADVYVRDGDGGSEKLLLRFRKDVLSPQKRQAFYENVIEFAHHTTENRGNATGNNGKRGVQYNKSVKSNILGFFDRWSPKQKYKFRNHGFRADIDVRPCRFNMEHPAQYKLLLPLLQEIDQWYKRLVPEQYAKQFRKARSIPVFRVAGTAFTTVTTNVNYRTSIHHDKGDDEEGFGNLVVLERGEYTGGETCFPQYGLAVDVREGDVLFMDVHESHGNLPIKTVRAATVEEGNEEGDSDAIRLSVVCYLRKKIWEKTRGKTRKQLQDWHEKILEFSGKGKPSGRVKTQKKNMRGGGSGEIGAGDGIATKGSGWFSTGLAWGS